MKESGNEEDERSGELDETAIRSQAAAIGRLRGIEENEALMLESGLFCVSANNLQPSDCQPL